MKGQRKVEKKASERFAKQRKQGFGDFVSIRPTAKTKRGALSWAEGYRADGLYHDNNSETP